MRLAEPALLSSDDDCDAESAVVKGFVNFIIGGSQPKRTNGCRQYRPDDDGFRRMKGWEENRSIPIVRTITPTSGNTGRDCRVLELGLTRHSCASAVCTGGKYVNWSANIVPLFVPMI